MAAVIKRLGGVSAPASDTLTRIYEVPAGRAAIVRTVSVSNDNATTARVGVLLNKAGWLFDLQVTQADSRLFPLSTVLLPGDVIEYQVFANSPTTYLGVHGVEFDYVPPTLVKFSLLSLETSAKSFVVPVGKKLRLREIIVCPHGGNGTVNISTRNLNHLVKATMQANTPLVVGMDVVVNAGEEILASATGTLTHAFFSGVLEDA